MPDPTNHLMSRLPLVFRVAALLLAAAAIRADSVPFVSRAYKQEFARTYTTTQGLDSNQVLEIHCDDSGLVYALTDKGLNVLDPKRGSWSQPDASQIRRFGEVGSDEADKSFPGNLRQCVRLENGEVLAATDSGLWRKSDSGLQRMVVADGLGRDWTASDVRGIANSADGLWVATPAGVAVRRGDSWQFMTGADGLPYADFTCVQIGTDGMVWFGTRMGVVIWKRGSWAYRQGKRWLPDDEVRDLDVDSDGQAWIATSNGVGLIGFREMSLAQKAEFYEDEMERYIRRTPYGYVSEVGLSKPGDKSQVHRHDSDNDGLWTAMYGAGECFAYGATAKPEFKERAVRAFKALQFLQQVTQGGSHPAPRGHVARTIRSVDLPDPNVGRLEHDRHVKANEDRLWKAYEPRWPKSEDGKWYWKSDTSSDELDGHYFFYPLYYDLVAETEGEKREVREVVRSLTDHLIKYGYNLVDHTGTPTRWGIYNPDDLNHNPDWWAERGLKSLSMLSYLVVANHVTGDSVYLDHFERLVRDHAYDTNAMIYKIHRGIGSGNQSDDEMAFMCFYNLTKYLKQGELRRRMLFSFYSAWVVEEPEMNPFFNFAYASQSLNRTYSDAWGTYSISPWDGWLEDSVQTLTGFPLDRCNWSSHNSHRLDIVLLPRQQRREITDPVLPQMGHLNNGKVLPVENRHFNHWNTNPWALDYGGDGTVLAGGTVFLLPYYMGLYHGFIQHPSSRP